MRAKRARKIRGFSDRNFKIFENSLFFEQDFKIFSTFRSSLFNFRLRGQKCTAHCPKFMSKRQIKRKLIFSRSTFLSLRSKKRFEEISWNSLGNHLDRFAAIFFGLASLASLTAKSELSAKDLY